MDDSRTGEYFSEDGCDPSDIAANIKVHKGNILDLTCYVCNNSWTSKTSRLPSRCPKCRSTRWNNPDIIHNNCKRCGHKWISEMQSPAKCPKCQSYKWNEYAQRYEHKCKRCSHEWESNAYKPAKCPKCKSAKHSEHKKERRCPKCGRSSFSKTNSISVFCSSCDPGIRSDEGIVRWDNQRKTYGTEHLPFHFDGRCGHGTGRKEAGAEKESVRTFDTLLDAGKDNDVNTLADMLGTEVYIADIFKRYLNGENPVRISIDLGVSFEQVMNVIASVGMSVKRY